RVAWSLGRRCNYDCHYCSDSVHSLKEPLKESERLLKATRRVIEEFCQGVPTEFLIAGGEPTLQPGLVEMVRMIHEAGHGSVVITNGSGREGVYRELARYSHICMSGHFGFMREERFLKNARTAIASVRTLPRKTRKVRRIDIKIMTPPGTFDRSIAFARRVLEIPNYQSYGTMRFNPLFMRDQPDRLYEYSRNELDKFTEYNDNWNQVLAFGRPGLIVRAYFWRGLRRVVKPVVAFTKSACLGLMKAFWLAPPVRWTRARLLKGYHFTEYVVLNRETTVPKAMALIGLRRR
ncbi:MAG TPA: radical SAM protein, partial [Bdellovibrionales bacterium]|nr:radical SAM protein [Bdellovibrionales bacterium]